MTPPKDHKKSFKERLYIVIFESDTRLGKFFDVVLLWAILISTGLVMAESVSEIHDKYGTHLIRLEWVFTILFTIEYGIRVYSARKPLEYIFSFYGIVDLLSILPSYLSLLEFSTQYLMIIRIFRLMRVFRVLKLARFMKESDVLWKSFKASRAKIAVFLFAVINVAIIMGTIMYIVEGGENGFSSIPRSVYWAIVTMTTVGYGDIHAHTALGQFFSMSLMILGYGIIAVPTGLVGVEIAREQIAHSGVIPEFKDTVCNNCHHSNHLKSATFCHKCGAQLEQ